jgi:hypothetical protein
LPDDEDLEDEDEDLTQMFEDLKELRPPTLSVHVDFLELMEKYGEEEAFIMLGKLKDLLG